MFNKGKSIKRIPETIFTLISSTYVLTGETNIQTDKTIEIQLGGPTEVCG